MIPAGTRLRLKLPGDEAEVDATVIACSARGQSCKLAVEEGNTLTVNLRKCTYEIISPSNSDEQDPSDDEESEEDSDDGEGESELEALDAFQEAGVNCTALEELEAAVAINPTVLLQPSEAIATFARNAAKELFEYKAGTQPASARTLPKLNAGKVPALYVDGFDPEQIWLQIDMAAGPALKKARMFLKKSVGVQRLIPRDVEEALDDLLAGNAVSPSESDDLQHDSYEDSEELEDEDEQSDGDGIDKTIDYEAMLEAGKPSTAYGGGMDGFDSSEDEQDHKIKHDDVISEKQEKSNKKRKRGRKLSAAEARAAVEDEYFKLDEMEAFLLASEQAQEDENVGFKELYGDDDDGDGDERAGNIDDRLLESDFDDDALEGDSDESGDDEDEGLEAAFEAAAGLVGLDRRIRKQKAHIDLSDEEGGADDDLADARYEDFFGPRKRAAPDSKKSKGSGYGTFGEYDDDDREFEKGPGVFDNDEDDDEDDGEDDDVVDDMEADNAPEGDILAEQDIDEGDSEDEHLGMALLDLQRSSKHEQKLQRTAKRVAAMEAEAMGERDWYLHGEVPASARPKNSALEVDLDFETTVKPPPAPTEEGTKDLEEMIRQRILEARFDDVVKIAPPPPAKKRTTIELDDKKHAEGLGELYERDYVAAVTGQVEDRDEPVRELAKAQFQALCAGLDALSHGNYRPTPSIEEVTVKIDVPAILMEETAPAFVSGASMRAPEEVYRPGTAMLGGTAADGQAQGDDAQGNERFVAVAMPGGGFKSEAELTKEDRKRRRAFKKRASRNRKAATEEERAAKAAAVGGVFVPGRKSEADAAVLRKMAKAAKSSRNAGSSRKFTNSSTVFSKIQAARDAPKNAGAKGNGEGDHKASHFKLS